MRKLLLNRTTIVLLLALVLASALGLFVTCRAPVLPPAPPTRAGGTVTPSPTRTVTPRMDVTVTASPFLTNTPTQPLPTETPKSTDTPTPSPTDTNVPVSRETLTPTNTRTRILPTETALPSATGMPTDSPSPTFVQIPTTEPGRNGTLPSTGTDPNLLGLFLCLGCVGGALLVVGGYFLQRSRGGDGQRSEAFP